MLNLTRLISWRYLRRHALRMVLATVSIALGVATLIASQVLNRSTLASVEKTSQQLAGKADLHVTNPAVGGVEIDLLPRVRQTPGVRAAVPFFARRVKVKLPNEEPRNVLMMGVDFDSEDLIRSYGESFAGREIPEYIRRTGRLPVLETPIAVLGEGVSVKPTSLQVLTRQGWRPVQGVATMKLDGAAAALGGNLFIMHIDRALDFMGQTATSPASRRVNRIEVLVQDGVKREDVQARLADVVSDRAIVQPPRIRDTGLEDVLAGVQIGLTLGAAVALFVGMFLVYNTLAVTVAERRHDIGIMRALGATRRQIRWLFAMEALILGAIGSTAGIFGGLGLAWLSQGTMSRILQQQFAAVELHELAWTPAMLVFGLLTGMGAALVASLGPATAAAAEPPSDALRRVPAQPHPFKTWWPIVAALLCIALGWTIYSFRNAMPPRVATYANLYLFGFGFMLATPFLARLGVGLLWPISRLLGTGGRLAIDDLARTPSRTGLTVGALALGLAMTIETAGLITSTEEPIMEWIERAVRAELLVTSGSAITGGGEHMLMDEALGEKLKLPGVQDIMPVRLKHIDFKDTRILITAIPLDTYRRHTEITLTSANPEAVDQLLNPETRTALVSDNFAVQQGLRVGDEVTLPTVAGRLPFRIAATTQNYSWNRGTIILDWHVYKKWFGDTLVDQFDVFLKPDVEPAKIQRQIEETFGPEHDLVILTNASLREHILKMLRHFYVLIYANAFMAMVVSFLGVANTLAISVLQRKRELGLLRAVGATRLQVAWSVIAQAFLIGVLGLALGVGLGVLLQEYVLQVLMVEETGYYFAFLFPVTMTLVTIAFAVTAAQAAAIVPAARAARLQISEAVAYE